MQDTQETWKVIPIAELKSRYSVSNTGLVKNNKTWRVMKPFCDRLGYKRINFSGYCGKRAYYIHRLVLLSFGVPNPENKTDVNHKNGIPGDNRLENLEWATRLENIRHALRTGLSAKGKGHVFLDGEKVKEIRSKYIPGHSGSLGRLSKEYGLKIGHLQKIVYREIWKHV